MSLVRGLGVLFVAAILTLGYSSLAPSAFADNIMAIREATYLFDFDPIETGPEVFTHDSDVVTDPDTSVSCDSSDGSMTSPHSQTSADSTHTTTNSPTSQSSNGSSWSHTSFSSVSSNDGTISSVGNSSNTTGGGNACSITDS